MLRGQQCIKPLSCFPSATLLRMLCRCVSFFRQVSLYGVMQMLCRIAQSRVVRGEPFQGHGEAEQGGAGVGQVLSGDVRDGATVPVTAGPGGLEINGHSAGLDDDEGPRMKVVH